MWHGSSADEYVRRVVLQMNVVEVKMSDVVMYMSGIIASVDEWCSNIDE